MNELSFRGSNRYPRSFHLVWRLCLFCRIKPVFIPIGEPWWNGVIEHVHDTYNDKSFRRQWVPPSSGVLNRQSKHFQRLYNRHHPYSCLRGKTPMDLFNRTIMRLWRGGRIPSCLNSTISRKATLLFSGLSLVTESSISLVKNFNHQKTWFIQ